MSTQVIVVGGGLAGLSAAHTVLESGGRVLVVDKNPFMGGNSTKATSGINGAGTKTQRLQNIADTPEIFEKDTALSYHKGAEGPTAPLTYVLTHRSGEAVEWLIDHFGLDLSLVSRLGGHSFPRTHRGKERFPGMTITMALMEKLQNISEDKSGRARVITKARVSRLIKEDGEVVGVEYDKDGQKFQEYGPVIIATGGFAADFTQDSILMKVRPDLAHLPTTNGDHCTGDGIKIAEAIGANSIGLEDVQVHPTGLVNMEEPDAKVKFLAAEALRGVGGILLDANGKRFCNELGRRDYVTGEMWKNKGPFRLVLNGAASNTIEWHCKHYSGRGLMKRFNSGREVAADMGIPVETLQETFKQYNEVAKAGIDEYGKKFFDGAPFDVNDFFHVSFVTPVLHYCMGGLQISPEAEVEGKQGPIPGLFAAGEVCGGVHGKNRLGGNSLLDCVVFGRVSGFSASKYLLNKLVYASPADAKSATGRVAAIARQVQGGGDSIEATVSQGGAQTRVTVDPRSKNITMNISWDDQRQSGPVQYTSSSPSTASPATVGPSQPTSASPSPSGSAPAQAKKGVYTLAEVAKHNTEKDCWVVVNGEVLDVTHFLKDHPGGKKAILLYAGKDATEEFNMLHKPDVVQKYAPQTVIGVLDTSSGPAPEAPASPASPAPSGADVFSKPDNPISRNPIQPTEPSNKESRNSGGTADILPAERAKSTFTVEKLTNILDGTPEKTKRRRWILSTTAGKDLSDKYFWDRSKIMKEHVNHFIDVHDEFLETFIPTREEVLWMSENTMNSGTLMNHFGLFIPTILGQGSSEQQGWWLPRAMTMKIIGTYGQTELGHGSNVRGLQTTAVYDAKNQQFILNTPTLRSIKWWPGTLGKVATHALVYAQLIIDGKEYGVHSFMVQIRDENHRPLPGIELGDCGPKLGDPANDTGFMRLENIRIPREFMLSKYQQVSPEGQYIKSSKKTNDKLHYATMMFTRGGMVKMAGGALARAVTIATRYSCVRTQGFKDTKTTESYKSAERQIIDHQVQRYRVFKQLALTYAMKFTGKWMTEKFQEIEGDAIAENLGALAEIAATSAGLKALTTFLASQGIEDCRKCCGGNGYLLASGVAALAGDYVWQTTAEGDWIILILQTARFLMKSLKNARRGEPVPGPVDYLAPLKDKNFRLQNAAPRPASSPKEFRNLGYLLSLFKFRALVNVCNAGESFQQKVEAGLKYDDAFNACSLEFVSAVSSHCYCFMLSMFVSGVEAVEDRNIKSVLENVCALFATSFIIDDQWAGVLDTNQLRMVRQVVPELLDAIRPNAIALTDAFDIPDRVLNSAVGRSDGNVYEALFEAAKKSLLNQRDPFDGYTEYLKPRLDMELLKDGNVLSSKL